MFNMQNIAYTTDELGASTNSSEHKNIIYINPITAATRGLQQPTITYSLPSIGNVSTASMMV